MNAAIISIGDELIFGETVDTNAAYIADRLAGPGITCSEHVTIGDDQQRLSATITRLCDDSHVDLLIITGGLGPTADDITREALADAMGETLVEDPAGIAHLKAWFGKRGITMPAQNRRQALRPVSASLIDNPCGTAPGIRATFQNTVIYVMPGVPREMRAMFKRDILPNLPPNAGNVIRTTLVHSFGLGESSLAEQLGNLMDRDRNPTVGTTASRGVVTCRIRATGKPEDAEKLTRETAAVVRERLGPYVFGRDEDTLASVVVATLVKRGETVTTIESCTGGLLGSMLTSIPGSSRAFLGGWVTYTNEMKIREVGVPAKLFEEDAPGAVSREVAAAMAEGGLRRSGAGHALAITGIAGPDGGTPEKPVGTVHIALASQDQTTSVRRFHFTGERELVRHRSAQSALAMLLWRLRGREDTSMLWQRTNGEPISGGA
ncbi:MAG: competence/damage-inducible protein A [Phycisphaerales bacterium]|nr:competence/damage-inducible protein A [Phycisphaerales bacterium]